MARIVDEEERDDREQVGGSVDDEDRRSPDPRIDGGSDRRSDHRERFICTDWRATAPGKSAFGTSVGRIEFSAGAPKQFSTPMDEHTEHEQRLVRVRRRCEDGKDDREHELLYLAHEQQATAVEHVGEDPT